MPEDFTLPDDTPENEEVSPPENPLYSRQTTLNLVTQQSVMIVGVGGVGVWVALSLALAGINRLVLYDGDELSTHNLNRFPLPVGFVGKPKSEAICDWLATLRPDMHIEARGMYNPEVNENALRGINYLVCCTDSLKSRRLCYKAAIDWGINYIEAGADGQRFSVSPKPPDFSTELEENPGYQTVPVHVGPCMMAGATVAFYVLNYLSAEVSHIGEWGIGYEAYGRKLQGLKLITLPEVEIEPAVEITCQICNKVIGWSNAKIHAVSHVYGHGNHSLRESKELVDSWIRELEGEDDEQDEQAREAETEAGS